MSPARRLSVILIALMVASLGVQVLVWDSLEEAKPEPQAMRISYRVKETGKAGTLTQRPGETVRELWQRVAEAELGKVECWESNGTEYTVTQPVADDEEAACEAFDEALEVGMELHPKTGECEPALTSAE